MSGGIIAGLFNQPVSPDRKGEHPRAHLASFRGLLQADGYAGFDNLYEAKNGRPSTVVEVACWAPVRPQGLRRASGHPFADGRGRAETHRPVVRRRGRARGRPTDRRRLIRQEKATPLIDELAAVLDAMLPKLPEKAISPPPSATPATSGRRSAATSTTSDTGGERAAALYTLIQTAKLNGLDPAAYLRDVLTRIADHPIKSHRRTPALEHRRDRTTSPRRLKAILTPR